MRIAACQFAVSGDMHRNFAAMEDAVSRAALRGVRLLAFPECSLTGYPPRNISSASAVDFKEADNLLGRLSGMSASHGIHLLLGAILPADSGFFNSAVLLSPGANPQFYHKRALWGWDRDNFCPGNESGIFEIDGFKIGVRICYELRFPEYFSELYAAHTDLNLVLFHDVGSSPDPERYGLLFAHLRTRACENICPILSVNSVSPYQTAPTALIDSSGCILHECAPGKPELLVYDLLPQPLDFSRQGRKEISDMLNK